MTDHARTARSLAAGRVPATARVAWSEGLFRVRYALDREGRPLLLCRAGGSLDLALAPGDVALVITVAGAAERVWISGWARALDGLAARAAAIEFALVNPLSDLLDVGRGFCLYYLDVAEVRLECGRTVIDVDIDDYVAAASEPVT
jgi:hypothetical protein